MHSGKSTKVSLLSRLGKVTRKAESLCSTACLAVSSGTAMTIQILVQLDVAPSDTQHLKSAVRNQKSDCQGVKASDRSSKKGLAQ